MNEETIAELAIYIVWFSGVMLLTLILWMIWCTVEWYRKGFTVRQSIEFMWQEIV